MELIYHYTTGKKLIPIFSTGKLMVSPWERSQRIKHPALWLSLNPVWEPTSAKMVVLPNGQSKTLTMDEHMNDVVGGLYRFVIPFDKKALCSWARYRHATDIDPEQYHSLEMVGKLQGANPQDWYASFDDIPLEKVLRIGVYKDNQWNEVDIREMMLAFRNLSKELK